MCNNPEIVVSNVKLIWFSNKLKNTKYLIVSTGHAEHPFALHRRWKKDRTNDWCFILIFHLLEDTEGRMPCILTLSYFLVSLTLVGSGAESFTITNLSRIATLSKYSSETSRDTRGVVLNYHKRPICVILHTRFFSVDDFMLWIAWPR